MNDPELHLPPNGPDHLVIPGWLAHDLWEWMQSGDFKYWETKATGELSSLIKSWIKYEARI